MNWNWRAMRAIMRKDLKQVTQNKMVWLPMVLVPAMLLIIFPTVAVLLPSLAPLDELEDLKRLEEILPPSLARPLQGLTVTQKWVMLTANYMFAPMFLIIPLMVASILGADSFAGEKERKTLEGLLYTPLTDTELVLAKLLSALIPALLVEITSFVLYGIIVNLAGFRVMGRIFFPAPTWWPLVFWLGPAISVAGLGSTILVSSKAKTFMEAQQLSGMFVLPIVVLMIGQLSGLFFMSVALIMGIGLLIWLLGLWLLWIGAKTFARGEIIARI